MSQIYYIMIRNLNSSATGPAIAHRRDSSIGGKPSLEPDTTRRPIRDLILPPPHLTRPVQHCSGHQSAGTVAVYTGIRRQAS